MRFRHSYLKWKCCSWYWAVKGAAIYYNPMFDLTTGSTGVSAVLYSGNWWSEPVPAKRTYSEQEVRGIGQGQLPVIYLDFRTVKDRILWPFYGAKFNLKKYRKLAGKYEVDINTLLGTTYPSYNNWPIERVTGSNRSIFCFGKILPIPRSFLPSVNHGLNKIYY